MTISQFVFDFFPTICYTYLIEYIISISCSNEFYIMILELQMLELQKGSLITHGKSRRKQKKEKRSALSHRI